MLEPHQVCEITPSSELDDEITKKTAQATQLDDEITAKNNKITELNTQISKAIEEKYSSFAS